MGKAIISIPLYNELPYPLLHKKNIYFTEDKEESIKQAVEELINDQKLREQLERGSIEYWNKYASPEAVIKYIINKSLNA